MLKFWTFKSCLVINPLFPNNRIMDKVSEKGGEITGSVAIVEKNFFPFTAVLVITKANRKPTSVEKVAVNIPSFILPQRAERYCFVVKMVFHVSRENCPSFRKVSRTASKSG